MSFESVELDSYHRIGSLFTTHGRVETPTIFPVYYIGGQVEWTTPRYWKEFPEIQTAMFNATHVSMNDDTKFSELMRKGIHQMLNFKGIAFLDSGGWIHGRHNIQALTQSDILDIQSKVGADIASTLDYPINLSYRPENENMLKSIKNAIVASRAAITNNSSLLLFASIHGSDPVMIRNIIKYLERSGCFDGYALGSLMPHFYNFEIIVDIIVAARRECPKKPLHVYGLGGPLVAELLAYLGVDTMDSAFFIKAAANRVYAIPHYKRMRISAIDRTDDLCSCKVCKRHGYNKVFQNRKLLALHNVWTVHTQLAALTLAMKERRIDNYLKDRFARTPWAKKAFEYAKHRMTFGSRY